MSNFDYLPENDYEDDEEIKRLRQIINNGPAGPTNEKEGAESEEPVLKDDTPDSDKQKKERKNKSEPVSQKKKHESLLKVSSGKEPSDEKEKRVEVQLFWSADLHYLLKLVAFLCRKSVRACIREAVTRYVEDFLANLDKNEEIDKKFLNVLKNL